MPTSITYKEAHNEFIINVEQICFLRFDAQDNNVYIQFSTGNATKFSGLSDKDKENLRRQLRVQPTY
jgi:hypothetical protein